MEEKNSAITAEADRLLSLIQELQLKSVHDDMKIADLQLRAAEGVDAKKKIDELTSCVKRLDCDAAVVKEE